MTLLFVILIVLACLILGFIILVQNPKGGGLTGNVAGLSNQFMGVKQTNDIMEKGTWIFAAIIGMLCLFSTFFMGTGTSGSSPLDRLNTGGAPAQQTAPAPVQQTAPATGTQTAPPAQQSAPAETPPPPPPGQQVPNQ